MKSKSSFNFNSLNSIWAFWYSCLWCKQTGADAFHHVMSPSSPRYVKGDFNQSVLNACPIHNHGCHLYNSNLHKIETEKKLLQAILRVVLQSGYLLQEIDKQFLNAYKKLYE